MRLRGAHSSAVCHSERPTCHSGRSEDLFPLCASSAFLCDLCGEHPRPLVTIDGAGERGHDNPAAGSVPFVPGGQWRSWRLTAASPYRTREFPRRTPFGDEEVPWSPRRSVPRTCWSGGTMVNELEGRRRALRCPARYRASSGTAAIHVAVGTIDPEPGTRSSPAPSPMPAVSFPSSSRTPSPSSPTSTRLLHGPGGCGAQDHSPHQGDHGHPPLRQPLRHGRHG